MHLSGYDLTQRVTVTIEDKLMVKLRNIQAKKLKNQTESVSFSKILNEIIEKGLKY